MQRKNRSKIIKAANGWSLRCIDDFYYLVRDEALRNNKDFILKHGIKLNREKKHEHKKNS